MDLFDSKCLRTRCYERAESEHIYGQMFEAFEIMSARKTLYDSAEQMWFHLMNIESPLLA